MTRRAVADIEASRLPAEQLRTNFSDVAPPLDSHQALIAAQRCFYCYDAPCTIACPTGIDIASFIRSLATEDRRSAAQTILDANILGGSCARVCPTEVLCEGACVRNGADRPGAEQQPVQIGALQRYATDWVYAEQAPLFTRGADSGKRVAVLGAGPAGLACAHHLARHGHRVEIYDPKSKPGGLNEYGIAAYKVPDFAQAEVQWLLSIGGIELIHRPGLSKTVNLEAMAADYDAVFVAVGLAGVAALNIPGEYLPGVRNAVDFIAAPASPRGEPSASGNDAPMWGVARPAASKSSSSDSPRIIASDSRVMNDMNSKPMIRQPLSRTSCSVCLASSRIILRIPLSASLACF